MASYNYDGIVIVALGGVIRDQLTSYFSIDTDDLEISRSYQPTEQYSGARADSAKYQVFLTPVTAGTAVGRGNTDSIDDDDVFTRTHSLVRRVTYQVDCLSDYDPSDDTSLEANDLAQAINELIMTADSIESLTSLDLAIESVTTVRPSYSITSEAQYESTPSFDITLTYNVEYAKEMDLVTSVEMKEIYRI